MKKQTQRMTSIIFSACIILYLLFFVTVGGTSMEPTLHDGQILLLNRFASEYSRGDIVVFKSSNRKLIKRVVALPGDTVSCTGGIVYVNGEAAYYGDFDRILDAGCLTDEITLPENQFFVLGDNRNNSNDSRFFGPVADEDILGKILLFKKG